MGQGTDQNLETLKRSLIDRADALSAYLGDLQARSGRSDGGFGLALRTCREYARCVAKEVQLAWDYDTSGKGKKLILDNHLRKFREREKWIDQRFARGNQDAVPRALKTIARREFAEHGLLEHEPVLTVGPPDSFDTHKPDLYGYLLRPLHVAESDEQLADLRHGRKLSIISLPYIEGTRAMWHPISLGHEIGHIRLDHIRHFEHREELTSKWLSSTDSNILTNLENEQMKRNPVTTSPRADIQRRLDAWVDEILCDLNAVRLFGPAGVSAISEFLAVKGSSEKNWALRGTRTHPPFSVRLELMLRYLKYLSYGDLPHHTAVWSQYRHSMQLVPSQDEDSFFTELIIDDDNSLAMMEHVAGWPLTYKGAERNEAVDWMAGQLIDGIPGSTHYRRPDGTTSQAMIADVVNAAWVVRDRLDEQVGETSNDKALLSMPLDLHEGRVIVDSLATKAIDSIELSQLRGDDFKAISPDHTALDRWRRKAEQPPGAVPSGAAITDRLRKTYEIQESRGLVVTPLFADSVQDASIDVRLGPDFIVFRHSSTGAFDPLEAQDPRLLQELVHKDWGEKFILHPGELVLAATLEYVVLPEDMAAQLVTRSSYGRLGLITATAVQIQPGSRGCITLELVNHAQTPIALSPGARIAQLMLFGVTDPCDVERGKYWFPTGPEFSKVHLDEDAKDLRVMAKSSFEVGKIGPISFEAVVSANLADELRAIAEESGLKPSSRPLQVEQEDESGIRSLTGDSVATVMAVVISGSAAISHIATFVYKWRRARNQSVVLQERDDGSLDVYTSSEMPTGFVVVVDRNGTKVRDIGPQGITSDIADAISLLAGKKRDAS